MNENQQKPYTLPPTQSNGPDKSKNSFKAKLESIKAWVKTHKKASIAIVAVILVLIGGGIAFALQQEPDQKPVASQKKQKAKPAPIYYSPLTGVKVADEAASKQPVTAVMIENSPDARPQSGLKDSGVVFEAIAEGGITRFLALYQQEKPGLVGPVRSLRPYYVDWLAPFQPSVAHVGGSKAALDEVRNGNYRDIDQFFNPNTYWRASDRYAPHNVYTNFEKLDALNREKGFTQSSFTGFVRKDDTPGPTPNASAINVIMSSGLYNSSYSYHPETNSYLRNQGSAAHLDREAGHINPKTVVIMKAPMGMVMEDGYRESIQTTGSGQAYIFQDGTVTEGSWHKPSRTEQITFTDAAGGEVKLNRGQTWLSIVPADRGSVTWQ